jgi:hypothetical protein
MKRMAFRCLLALTLLLTACGGKPPVSAPVAAPAPAREPAPATAGTAPAAPATAPAAADNTGAKSAQQPESLAAICQLQKDTNLQAAMLRQHVADLLKGVAAADVENRVKQEPGTCLHAEPGPVPDLFLVQGDSKAYWPAVIAWRAGGPWHVVAVDKGYMDLVKIGTGTIVDGRPNLILVGMSSGTSGAKTLVSFSVDDAGKGTIKQVSGTYGKSGFEFLRPDLVLVTHRARLWDQFPGACNGCVPSREQELLQWTGETFQSVATRLISEPNLTLNLLQDALIRGDQPGATGLVSRPDLVAAARSLLQGGSGSYTRFGTDVGAIAELEGHNWDALPAELRTTLPPRLQVYFTGIQTADGTAHVLLNRRPDGWVVSGISTPDRANPVSMAAMGEAARKLDRVQANELPAALTEAVPLVLRYLDWSGEDLSAGTADPNLPGWSFLPAPAPGKVRLVYLGHRVNDLVGGAWTWLQWQDGTVIRDQLLRQAEDWEPLQVVRVGTGPSVTLAVLWQSASTPHDQEVAVYQLDGQTWAKPYVFTNAWDVREKGPVPFEPGGDHLTLRGSTGGIISLMPDGQTVKVCAKGLDPCLSFRWTGTAYIGAAN